MSLNTEPAWRRYLIAAALMVAAVSVRLALSPLIGKSFPYTTVVMAALASAPLVGTGPAMLATLGTGGLLYALLGAGELPRLAAAVLISGLIIWVVALLQKAYREAAESARLADERLAQLRQEASQRAEEERQSSQLRAIVESSDDAVISKDLGGIIQTWNLGAERVFGYRSEEILGKHMSTLVPPERLHEETDILERIRRGGRVKHFETERMRNNGQRIHVSMTISPIRDAGGQIVGVSNIARDITERLALEEQLRQTQRLESLGVLAGGMAHHFNNLLTGIVGNASLAMDDADHPEVRARLRDVLQLGDRAALLIRQILAYAGKGRFVVEPLDVSQQVQEVVALLRTTTPKEVELKLDLAPGLPPVEADRSQIQQLVMNLALNAVEAIGERRGCVTIRTAPRQMDAEDQVVIEVSDTGCGMDEATKARIFDPFFTTKFTGRGLGLAAVAGIIRAQNGSINVETAPDQGCTFTVVLPALKRADDLQVHPEIRGYGHLLVADQEELTRNMARFALERCGYTVQLASDGRSAVEAFAADPSAFSAVLLDLTLAVSNGQDALHRMQEIAPRVPVVLSSRYPEGEALSKIPDRRLAGFLQKPYTPTALARKIKQALRG